MIKFRNESGDTILEVLISVAVLSLILGISFTLANRSSLANQQAAERVEAYNYAQANMELLKSYMTSNLATTTLPAGGARFCFTYNPSDKNQITGVTTLPASYNIDNDYNKVTTPASCKRGTASRYVTVIERGAGVNSNLYTIHVRWESVRGHGTDKIDMIHKIYPASSAVGVYLS